MTILSPNTSSTEVILLKLASESEIPMLPGGMRALQDKLCPKPTPRKWPRITLPRLLMFVVAAALIANVLATCHGRETLLHCLSSHLPGAVLYGSLVLMRRMEKHRVNPRECEKEILKEVVKAIVETSLWTMVSAAFKSMCE